jgi:magnesium-transporting ATPase (P-type)
MAGAVAAAAIRQKPGPEAADDSSISSSSTNDSSNGAAAGGAGGNNNNLINTVQPTLRNGQAPPFEVSHGGEEGLWHALDTERCVAVLGASKSSGLPSNVATNRLLQFGANELQAAPKQSVWVLVKEQFEDRLVQILLCVAVFSAITSSLEARGGDEGSLTAFLEPTVILTILVLNAGVGVWQGRSAEGALNALQKMQPSLATVLRDGAPMSSSTSFYQRLVVAFVVTFAIAFFSASFLSVSIVVLSYSSQSLSLPCSVQLSEGAWITDLPARELVPGDIIQLRVGDKVRRGGAAVVPRV